MQDVLFITDAFNVLDYAVDTSCFLMVTAQELNYNVYSCQTNDMFIQDNEVYFRVHKTHLLYSSSDLIIKNNWYSKDNSILKVGKEFSAIIVRKDPPFDIDYYYMTQILQFAEDRGAVVHNNSFSLRNYNEKLSILNFPDCVTPSIVSKNKHELIQFLEFHHDCIIKPLNLMGGRGIFKLSLNDINSSAILSTVTNNYTQVVMVQKFIPEIASGDKRIIIIDGEVINICWHRPPKLSNISTYKTALNKYYVSELTNNDMNVSKKVAAWLREHKIIFAGIDIIGNYLTEINITSPSGLKDINDLTQVNIAKLFYSKIFNHDV